MAIEQITPIQAKEILDKDPSALYLDVRSMVEFERGHAEGAINIPLLHLDEETQQMVPNADFAQVGEAHLPRDKRLLVGCMAGGRSQKACDLLQQKGYTNLSNILGGYGGGRNPATGEAVPGWSQSNLPVSRDPGEGVGYESLLKKAK